MSRRRTAFPRHRHQRRRADDRLPLRGLLQPRSARQADRALRFVISYTADTRVLVDTTPELRLQCVANGVDRIDAVVYTHAHADHVMGLDDLRRFNAISGRSLDVWADARTQVSLHRGFGYAFLGPPPPEHAGLPSATSSLRTDRRAFRDRRDALAAGAVAARSRLGARLPCRASGVLH